MSSYKIGNKQKTYAHCARYQVMLADICALADDTAQIRHSKGDESYRTADGYRTGNQEHDRQKKQGLVHGTKFYLSFHMPGQRLRRQQCGGQAYCKQGERKEYVSCRNSFKVEVSGSPEIILLEKVSIRSIRNHYCSKGTDEGSEQNTEGNEILRAYLESHEEAYCRTYQCTYETAYGERAPSGHCCSRRSKTCSTSKTKAVDISELVSPEILHLHATYRQCNS